MSGEEPDRLCEFEFTEAMWGYMDYRASTWEEGYRQGKSQGEVFKFEVTIRVKELAELIEPGTRRAAMTGWVTWSPLSARRIPLEEGEFGLYWVEPSSGERRMTYGFSFSVPDGTRYRFFGYKAIVKDPGILDILHDHTTLFSTLFILSAGKEEAAAKGILHFPLWDAVPMVFSMRCPRDNSIIHRAKMVAWFFSFAADEVGEEYFRDLKPVYRADYRNVVLRGTLARDGSEGEFFLFSGVHEKGFPWGDNIGFWDIGLVVKEGGGWRRLALTGHAIEGLELHVGPDDGAEGSLDYAGPLYEVVHDIYASFKDMHSPTVPDHLRKIDGTLHLTFTGTMMGRKSVPFDVGSEKVQQFIKGVTTDGKTYQKVEKFTKWLEKVHLGYGAAIFHLARVRGTIDLGGTRWTINDKDTVGEGEIGAISSFRKPPLYYNYFCAVDPPAEDTFRVHVRSGVLPVTGQGFLLEAVEEFADHLLALVARMDYAVERRKGNDLERPDLDDLITVREDLLEIDNNQYPHATFQRRIVAVPGLTGGTALALEEDMNAINLEPVDCSRVAHVAAIRHEDRFHALDRALAETGFLDLLDRAWKESGKMREDFLIVVKPNFSFMYSLSDISTYTDPRLVEHLVDRIWEAGYRNLVVAEAQSTYASFFTNRDVPTLARYLGFKEGGRYRIVDLSAYEDDPEDETHPLWKEADFRISFAKNKTHAYASYTLSIKNIYGALPRSNKFREYHCNYDEFGENPIYTPTIAYLKKYPVHFGLIDAYISADGQFGVFADKEPNYTSTIIAGDDLVALDWVGASKMGLDPKVSKYMTLAIREFGKPEIRFKGDQRFYPHWRNVPQWVKDFALRLDRHYEGGAKIYAMAASLDPFFVFKIDDPALRALREASAPFRKIFFEWVKGSRHEMTLKDLKGVFQPGAWNMVWDIFKVVLDR